MTFNHKLVKKVSFDLYLAGLSLSTYAVDAVYQLSNAEGSITLSESSGVITLPAGRYMLEASPHIDAASTSDVVKWSWQQDNSGTFETIGLEGQLQVIGDTIGEKDLALAVVDSDSAVDVRLIVTAMTSSGTPTDDGGCVVIWRES